MEFLICRLRKGRDDDLKHAIKELDPPCMSDFIRDTLRAALFKREAVTVELPEAQVTGDPETNLDETLEGF